jgi:hypothetical protein
VHENVGGQRLAVRVDWLGFDASVERDGSDQLIRVFLQERVSETFVPVGQIRSIRRPGFLSITVHAWAS